MKSKFLKIKKHIRKWNENRLERRRGGVKHRFINSTDGFVILTTQHCMYVAELIQSALARIGFNASIITSKPDRGFEKKVHFVICPQMFKVLPALYFSYQMEQSISDRWFTEDYIDRLEKSIGVMDYSLGNIEYLQSKGLHAKQLFFVPIGERRHAVEKEYDVLFYGDINVPRRQVFLSEIGKKFKTKIITNAFGEVMRQEIKKARVVVNIHYYLDALLETTRIYECLSLGATVVSEASSDLAEHGELVGRVHFVATGDVDDMVSQIEAILLAEKNNTASDERNTDFSSKTHALASGNFDYYFFRMLLAYDVISFPTFYDLCGSMVDLRSGVVCLGMPEYFKRKKSFEDERVDGFKYFPGLRHQVSWVGCGLSYKFIMRRALDQGLSSIAVCEDDVEFKPGWQNRMSKMMDFLQGKASRWHIFSGLIADLNAQVQVHSVCGHEGEEIIELDKMTSTVFNVYNKTVFPILARWDESVRIDRTNTIDRYLENAEDIRVFTAVPYVFGHKEDLDSTIWGFGNQTYSQMIATSERKLSEQVAAFKESRLPNQAQTTV